MPLGLNRSDPNHGDAAARLGLKIMEDRIVRVGNDVRIYRDVRVADLLLSPLNVERMKDALGHDATLVKRYAAMTTQMPPIKIRKVPGGYWVLDGGHRLAAANMRGDIWIPTVERPCE